jgi:hypothetical protein
MYSNIGKFEGRKLVAEFDALLIQLHGRNMTDAKITRQEAIASITAHGPGRSRRSERRARLAASQSRLKPGR